MHEKEEVRRWESLACIAVHTEGVVWSMTIGAIGFRQIDREWWRVNGRMRDV